MVPFAQKLLDAQLAFSTAFEAGVQSLKEGVDILWPQKAEKVSLPGTEEAVFGFLAEMPLFKLWRGERTPQRLKVGSYSLKVLPYEFSYEVGRREIKFDKLGLLSGHFRGAGVAQVRFYEDNTTAIQAAGKTGICFDGQFFYDTDHPQGLDGSGSTFQNLWTATDLTLANVATRYAYMTKLKDANGKRMGVRPNIIEYGPGYFNVIREIFQADIITEALKNVAGTENVALAGKSNTAMKGLLTPIMNPDLEDDVWYLHDTRVMKPFIIMEETPPTGLEMRVDPTDPHVWDNDAFLFGARAEAGFGYGIPHLSARMEK